MISKNEGCRQARGQERSLWSEAHGEFKLGGDREEAEDREHVPGRRTRVTRSLDKDAEWRMHWAYLYEPKY